MSVRAVVRNVGADGWVDLELARGERCAGCAGACLWRRLPEVAQTRLPSAERLEAGTPVLILLPERYLLLSALLLHGLPWAALLLGGAAGSLASGTDLGALAGAVLAAAFSIIMTPRLRRRLEHATMERFSLLPLA
jgi:positive regulator of sigma E activity